MTKPNAIQPLYNKIKKLGYTKPQIQSILPDWWDDAIANTPAGLQEATLILAKRLSINYSSLLTDEPVFSLPTHCFKHTQAVQIDKLTKAVTFATLASDIVHQGYNRPLSDIKNLTASSIREHILKNEPWVDINSLVEYCWDIGIPVIFLKNIPTPKMQGLALQRADRPTIILTSNRENGWLVFDLAHELGHIILEHVNNDTWVVDKEIKENNAETQEIEANQFANVLLTGKPELNFTDLKLSPKGLANSILAYGRANQIDPLHLLFNYSFKQKKFALANKSLPFLLKDMAINQTDQNICQSMLLRNIDINQLDDENSLRYLIGVDK